MLYNFKKGIRRTVSYAKYKYEKYYGVKLNDNQTVDHIDEDHTNDKINNLQILTRVKNVKKSFRLNKDRQMKFKKLHCCWCGIEFKRELSQYKYDIKSRKIKYGFFCSKKCNGGFTRFFIQKKNLRK